MIEQIRDVPGREFDLAGYLADFWPRLDRTTDVLWKLERIQDFREPDDPSWVAMTEGDWGRALRLHDEKLVGLREYQERTKGFARRRLRVVEHPVTPYLQWEMYVLRLRAQAGEQGRVIPAEDVSHLEARQPLPELLVVGSEALYEVIYDATRTLSGGRRIDDPDVITACRQELAELYDKAEDLTAYFDREIAPLLPLSPGG
jgi:hypothetical protein